MKNRSLNEKKEREKKNMSFFENKVTIQGYCFLKFTYLFLQVYCFSSLKERLGRPRAWQKADSHIRNAKRIAASDSAHSALHSALHSASLTSESQRIQRLNGLSPEPVDSISDGLTFQRRLFNGINGCFNESNFTWMTQGVKDSNLILKNL